MKPYGREKKIRGGASRWSNGNWKKDFHTHTSFRKIGNWWEDMCTIISRSSMKQNFKKDISDDKV
jgi:hypothetical protein